MDNWRKARASNPNGACIEIGSEWRKSGYSQGANNCAEVGAWRKSGYSIGSNANCVEAGQGEQVIGVRDTKEGHLGEARTVLEFTPGAWGAFLAGLRQQ